MRTLTDGIAYGIENGPTRDTRRICSSLSGKPSIFPDP